MRKPTTRKAAKRRAWEAISQYIRRSTSRGPFPMCVTCDYTARYQDMHCGHFQHGLTYGKDADGKPFVWEENLHVQCPRCNTFNGGMLDKYTLYMIDMYGRSFVEELQIERHKPVKMSIDDYWQIEQEYRERLGEVLQE